MISIYRSDAPATKLAPLAVLEFSGRQPTRRDLSDQPYQTAPLVLGFNSGPPAGQFQLLLASYADVLQCRAIHARPGAIVLAGETAIGGTLTYRPVGDLTYQAVPRRGRQPLWQVSINFIEES